MRIRYIITALLIIFSANRMFSQMNETVVTYDIDKQEFDKALPFDETFKIKIKSTKSIAMFKVKYKLTNVAVTDNDFKKYYFQSKADADGYISKDISSNSQSFSIDNIGPLHPNTAYTFEFYSYEKVKTDDAAATAMKTEIGKLVNKLYVTSNKVPALNVIKREFDELQKKYTGDLFDNKGKPLSVADLFRTDLFQYRVDLYFAKARIRTAEKNYNGLLNPFTFSQAYSDFCALVQNLKEDQLHNPQLLSEPVSLLAGPYNAVPLKDMITFFKLDCNRNFQYLKSILSQKAKFSIVPGLELLPEGKGFENKESLMLLHTSFVLMNNLKKVSNPAQQYFGNTIDNSTIITLTEKLALKAEKIAEGKKEITDLNTEIPNILFNKYSQSAYKTGYYGIADVESKATPYINLDLGFLFATGINDVFSLQTANFHFRPVNRNALFCKLKGWDKFFKQTCLQIGLAQRLGPSDERYDTFLTGGLGTPYMGVGYRVNRVVRISAGMILYEEKSNNPVITDSATKGAFSFTITINSALSEALGAVGKILKGVDK